MEHARDATPVRQPDEPAQAWPQPAPRARPEKRLATFVKCDLVDSTRWSMQLPLEDQRALSKAFRDAVAVVAGHQSGHVMRYEGDAVLLSFGHPEAREDATECAVRAGLALVGAVAAIRAVPGAVLQVRVGIATGDVAVGDVIVEGDRIEHAVDGPAPAMAERLRAVGEPGQVVVSEATRRLCGRFFEYADLGVVPAKGIDAGLRAWRVVAETAVESSFEARRHDSADGAIVGRESERSLLADAWSRALAGQGSVLVLTGEPGIGKSRLCHEALQAALDDGATVLRIDCTPRTSRTPFFPIGVLLRRLAEADAAAGEAGRSAAACRLLDAALGADEAREAWPLLAPLFGVAGVAMPAGLMPNEVRDRTIAANVALLKAVGATRRVFILCEDLHWVDATTLHVLEQVAKEVAAMRCLLLATSRSIDEERYRWLAAYPRIELSPLSVSDASRLVRQVNPTADDALVPLIVARAGATPLWLIEFASEVERSARLGSGTSVDSVPTSLKLVMQSRLERWPELKPLVQAASVLGREFPVELLGRVLGTPVDDILPGLRLLGRHGIFQPLEGARPERAEFRHAMIREAVYDVLMRDDKRRWHSSAADELAAMHSASADGSAEARAFHLEEAQRFDEAVGLHLLAAGEAAERGALVEAVSHCAEGLRLLDRLADDAGRSDSRVALLVLRAVALSAQYGFGAAVVEEAYELAAVQQRPWTPDVLCYAIARGRTGVRLLRGNLAAAHELSAEGLMIAERSDSAAHRLDAISMRLYTTLYAGTLDDCWRLVDEFMPLYAAADGDTLRYPAPQNAKTAMFTLMPTVAWLRGDPVAAEQAVRDGLAHVEALQRPYDQAMLHSWLAGTRCTQRRFAEALQHAAAALGIAEPRGYRDWIDSARLIALLAQMMLMPSPELIAMARGACQLLDAGAIGLNASWYRWLIAQACHALGEHEQAQAVLDEAQARADASGERRMTAELLLLAARLPHNAARAASLRMQALDQACALGDAATALRAAAAHVLADAAADADRSRLARAAEAALAGPAAGAPDAADRVWMHRSLEALMGRTLPGRSV
jgi:class 3 adenylate cyclase